MKDQGAENTGESGGAELRSALAGDARAARLAQRALARRTAAERDALLRSVAAALRSEEAAICAANELDLAAARATGVGEAMLDRLRLDQGRLAALAADVEAVAALPDPLAGEHEARVLPSGLRLARRRVPLGVVGVIYEARPNVTIDVAAAALKSGNAVVLRGGREALHSNGALAALVQRCLVAAGLPEAVVTFVERPEREAVGAMLSLAGLIDVVVPRGGDALIAYCREHSRIPLIAGGVGVVHIYVDASADLVRALDVIENAKVQRPAVCNALDTLLVDKAIAPRLLPALASRLAPRGVTFRADERALPLLPGAVPAEPGDFDREWLALTLGVRVVDGLDAALEHIAEHGSGHSEAILTATPAHAERFLAEVDAAAVYVNASTRFTDGGQFGMGVEVAVSTQRLHARGPVGPAELTSVKWVGRGDYLARA